MFSRVYGALDNTVFFKRHLPVKHVERWKKEGFWRSLKLLSKIGEHEGLHISTGENQSVHDH
jgi:hypothetical protein